MSLTLNVPSMKCEGCVDAVVDGIKAKDAAATVKVDLDTKRVDIESALSEADVKAAIAAAGHQVA